MCSLILSPCCPTFAEDIHDQHLDKTLDLIGFRAEEAKSKVVSFKKRN